MSISLLEVMERVGNRNTNKIKKYVGDALLELGIIASEDVERSFINVVADQRLYNLPSNMATLKGVFRKYDSDGDKYIRIGNIQNVDIQQDASATALSEQTDIIVL